MKILVANIGSTSFKYRLIDTAEDVTLARGKAERIDGGSGYRAAIESAIEEIVGVGKPLSTLRDLDAVSFKAVHGGECSGVRFVDDTVLKALEEFTFYAPAHNIPYLAAMRAFAETAPSVPLVAVFETGFFDRMDEAAVTYAVPYEWKERYGIRRYGFHGASHRAASERVQALMPKRPLRHISCHLGGSSSIAAILDGRAVDTSFGISPQSGLPQNNRVGDIDAFAVLAMMKRLNAGVDEMASILSTESGLAGIGGGTGDVRDLMEAAAAGDSRAKLAIQTYARSARNYIAQFYVALGGVDVVSFTGGIGENSPELRAEICRGLGILGIQLDDGVNTTARGEVWIEQPASPVRILMMPADEERVLARATADFLTANR